MVAGGEGTGWEMAQDAAVPVRLLCWNKNPQAGIEREQPQTDEMVPSWVRALLADAYAPLHLRRNEKTDRCLKELSRAGVELNLPENGRDSKILDLLINRRKTLAVTLLGNGEALDMGQRFSVPFITEEIASRESSLSMAVVCDLAVTGVMPLKEACAVIQSVADFEAQYGHLPADKRPTMMPIDVSGETADNIERAKGVKVRGLTPSEPPPDPAVVRAEEERAAALADLEATMTPKELASLEVRSDGSTGIGPMETGSQDNQPGRGSGNPYRNAHR